MTNPELYSVAPRRHPTGDALRTLILILATVLVGLAITAAVPEHIWAELSATQNSGLPDWHGNVATH